MNYKRIFAIVLAILMLSQTIPVNQFPLYQCNESYAAEEVSASKPSVTESPVSHKATVEAIPTSTLTQTQNNLQGSANNNQNKVENRQNQILVKYKDTSKKRIPRKNLFPKNQN